MQRQSEHFMQAPGRLHALLQAMIYAVGNIGGTGNSSSSASLPGG